jgi:hypothetical protein
MVYLKHFLWWLIKLPFNLLLKIIFPGKRDGRTKTGYFENKKPPRI